MNLSPSDTRFPPRVKNPVLAPKQNRQLNCQIAGQAREGAWAEQYLTEAGLFCLSHQDRSMSAPHPVTT